MVECYLTRFLQKYFPLILCQSWSCQICLRLRQESIKIIQGKLSVAALHTLKREIQKFEFSLSKENVVAKNERTSRICFFP